MGDLLSGLDLCFDPTNLGPQDPEGHYTLGFGLIQRATTSVGWSKVNGFDENVTKNTDFVINLWDLSRTVQQIAFVTIAWRPDSADTSPSPNDSPFNQNDFDTMLQGKVLAASAQGQSCGCGSGGANATATPFLFGTYTFKNSGPFEVTIEMRITVNGQSLEFKCDPKIIVGG